MHSEIRKDIAFMKKYLILTILVGLLILGISASKKEVKTVKEITYLKATYLVETDTLKDKLIVKPVETLTKLEEISKTAHVSYYGGAFHGKRTASGKPFNKNELTAAHRSLPFGTKVEFTNPKTKEKVIVTINDRGPFIKGRTFDLSEGAFKKVMRGTAAGKATLNYVIVNGKTITPIEKSLPIEEKITPVVESIKNELENPIVLKDTLIVSSRL